MRTYQRTMSAKKVNSGFNLSVCHSEKREGFFIIHPAGAINTFTSPMLQNEVEQIFASKPEIILFDMEQVNYINCRGLRVILKTIVVMDQCYGKVYLTNLQPQIKNILKIINGGIPEWVFESRKQLENYLGAIHNSYPGYSDGTKFEAGMDTYYIGALINSNQGVVQSIRM